jgi:hypothetical protein
MSSPQLVVSVVSKHYGMLLTTVDCYRTESPQCDEAVKNTV